MKVKKRRSTFCNNCDSELQESYNFCPVCGQSNTDNNITFWTLIKEFLDNYLGIDSKMAHSFVPFLIRPGTLTNRFQEGKIKHFIHPVRLYLVMSLIYFFTISYLLSDVTFTSIEQNAQEKVTSGLEDFTKNEQLKALPDSVKLSFVPDSIRNKFSDALNFDAILDSMKMEFGEKSPEAFAVNLDGLLAKSGDEPRFERLHRLARDVRISDDAFLDSLSNGSGPDNFSFFGREATIHLKSQIRKIFKNDEGFKGFVLGNLPLMMLILIPLFAGVLKLIYVRRKHLYIKHVVHSMHVHSFAYLMYAICLLICFKILTVANFPAWNVDAIRSLLSLVFFVGVSTYVYVSFRKVYQQGWFKIFLKFNIVGSIYAFFLIFFFAIELLASFWYY